MPSLLGSQTHFKEHFQTPIERDADVQRANELKSLILPFICVALKPKCPGTAS